MDREREMNVNGRAVGGLMVLSGVLISVGGAVHPRPKGDTVEEAAIGMMGAEGWAVAHLPQAFGVVVLFVVALLIRNSDGVSGALRAAATLAAVGTAVAGLESIPHILAGTEAAALAEGGATPLYDIHLIMQAFATPLMGAGVAALAWIGSRDGVLGPRPVALLGVIGGVGFGLAGPSVLLTDSLLLARLFMALAAVSLWLMLSGLVVLRASRSRSATAAVAGAS